MVCPNCKHENTSGNMYCLNCGAYLGNQAQYNAEPQQYQNNNYSSDVNNSAPPINQYQDYGTENTSPMSYNSYNAYQDNNNKEMSFGKWLGLFCLNLIPCVGSAIYIVVLFMYAFGNSQSDTVKNYARAQLVYTGITVIALIFVAIILTAIGV